VTFDEAIKFEVNNIVVPTKKIIRNEEAIMEGKEEIRLNPAMTTDLINRVNSFLISPHPFFYNSVR